MSGTVADKATAFRHELTGSSTNKIVCKASNHDLAGPKKKHVDCKHHHTLSVFTECAGFNTSHRVGIRMNSP